MILDHEKISRIKNALKFHSKGMSISEIAQQLKMNRNSVAKYLEILLISGQVEAKKYGTSKVYTLSSRVPVSAMMDFSSDLIIMLDSDKRILQANNLFLEFAGVTREVLIGQSIEETGLPFLQGLPIDSALTESAEKKIEIVERKVQHNGKEVSFGIRLVSTIFDDGTLGATIIIEDISDRKATEKALKESEKLYRSVIDHIQDVYYRTDRDGNLIMASPSGASVLGYTSIEEGIGRNIAEMFYADPAQRKEILDILYRNGSVTDYEIVLKRKDGTPLYISTNSHLFYDESGAVLGVEGIFRDITERKHAEESLKKSEELFSNVAQNSPLPIAIIDPDGTYHFINQSFVETFGYDLDDFRMGREWFLLAFPDPEYRKEVIGAWQSDFEHSSVGELRPRTYTVRCKNGIDKIIFFRPITLSDGKQCIIYEDITEHIESRRVRELLSSIVESTDDAIIGKDNNGTIISWNQAAQRIYGYSSEEIIGHHISQIIPPERREEMERILKQIRNGEVVHNLETLRVRKDGKVIEVDVTISPIRNSDGAVMGASTIARDISSRKAEERLKDSEEKYRSLVDTITVGVYRSTGDPAGKFTWGNSSLVSILGYPSLDKLKEIEIAGIFVEPDGRKKFLEELQREKFVKNKEMELRRADGTTIRVSVTALAHFNPKGDLVYINGIVEDITDQTKAEHQLEVLHKEIVDIIEFLPDATFVVDTEKRVVAWNAAMERLTGMKKTEIIGRGDYAHALPFYGASRPLLLDLLDAPDEEILKYYSGAKREGPALIMEGLVRSLYGGKGASLWAKAYPLKDPAGNRTGSIETIRELSEPSLLPGVMIGEQGPSDATARSMQDQPASARAVAQEAGQAPGYASLLYLSNALKMANDGITLLDLSARCIWANDALVTLLGVQNSDAIVGRSVAQYIASEMRKPTLDRLSEVRKHGHDSFPLFLMTPTGRVPVEASISVVSDEAGELLGYMAILRGVKNAAPQGSVKTGGSSQTRAGKKESKV